MVLLALPNCSSNPKRQEIASNSSFETLEVCDLMCQGMAVPRTLALSSCNTLRARAQPILDCARDDATATSFQRTRHDPDGSASTRTPSHIGSFWIMVAQIGIPSLSFALMNFA